MKCPTCHGDTDVTNSRPRRRGFSVWRRRRCRRCRNSFTTSEQILTETAIAFKAPDGSLQPLSRNDIYISVLNALGGLKTASGEAEQLTLTCLDKIFAEKATVTNQRTIERHIFETLSAYDNLAGQRYLLNDLQRAAA